MSEKLAEVQRGPDQPNLTAKLPTAFTQNKKPITLPQPQTCPRPNTLPPNTYLQFKPVPAPRPI